MKTKRTKVYFCTVCGTEIGEYYLCQPRLSCSPACLAVIKSRASRGERNPNFKHGKNYYPTSCKDCKTQIDYRSLRCHKCHGKAVISPLKRGRVLSYRTKQLIGVGSAKKFTPEFKKKRREAFEKLGYWIPLTNLPARALYFKQSNWTKEINKIFVGHGDTLGLVRDHKYSRQSGFLNSIAPILMRHPVNCELLTHAQNITKHFTNKDSISLAELIDKVLNYKGEWEEQKECVAIIKTGVML